VLKFLIKAWVLVRLPSTQSLGPIWNRSPVSPTCPSPTLFGITAQPAPLATPPHVVQHVRPQWRKRRRVSCRGQWHSSRQMQIDHRLRESTSNAFKSISSKQLNLQCLWINIQWAARPPTLKLCYGSSESNSGRCESSRSTSSTRESCPNGYESHESNSNNCKSSTWHPAVRGTRPMVRGHVSREGQCGWRCATHTRVKRVKSGAKEWKWLFLLLLSCWKTWIDSHWLGLWVSLSNIW